MCLLAAAPACTRLHEPLSGVRFPGPAPSACTWGSDRGDARARAACAALSDEQRPPEQARLHIAETTAGEPGPVALLALNVLTVASLATVGLPVGTRIKHIRVRYAVGDCVLHGQAADRQLVGLYYPRMTNQRYARLVARAISSLGTREMVGTCTRIAEQEASERHG
jgi:hypothetical protein